MSEKQLKTRILMKHDTEAHWNQAENFIPKAGEVIIYDADVAHDKPRMKVGNGTTKVSSLPFMGNESGGEELKISTGLKYNKANELQVVYGDFLDGPFTHIPIFDPIMEDQDNNTFIYFDSPYSYADNFNNEKHDVKFYNKTKDYDIELDTRIQLNATDIESLKAAVAAMGGQIDIDEGFYYQINCNQTPTELVSNLMLTGSLGIVPLDDTKFAGLIIFSAAKKSEPFAINWTLWTLINESIEDNLLQFESEEDYILQLPPMAIEPGLISEYEDRFVNGGTIYNFIDGVVSQILQSTVPINRTIAGISLENNILTDDLKTALSITNPIQSNWLEEDSTSLAFIQNKPDVATKTFVNNGLATKANTSDLALVATTGNYQSLSNKPTQLSDFINNMGYVDETTVDGKLANYALLNQLPTKTSELTNDSGFLTQHQSLSGYATETYVANAIVNKADKSELPTNPLVLSSQGAYNCNTLYDGKVWLIAQGSNCPSGSQYGSLFMMPYRKASGNSKPDYGVQIFIPNGDDATKPNTMFYRTSLASSWNAWKEVAVQNECNANTVDGYHIVITNALPSDASSHTDTIYIIT